MGCEWSSEAPIPYYAEQWGTSIASVQYPTQANLYYGVAGKYTAGFLCGAFGGAPPVSTITPTMTYGTANPLTTATCDVIDISAPSQSLKCPVEVRSIEGVVHVEYWYATSGTSSTANVFQNSWSAFKGPTPTNGVYTEYYTTSYASTTVTTPTSTVTTPTLACPPPDPTLKKKLLKKAVCNADLVLRALSNNAAAATTFCNTYTLSSATAGYPYPNFLTSWSTTSTRISSACSCFNGAATTPPPNVNAPGCNADDPLRSLRVNSDQASTFCATYTLSNATPGQSYPKYMTSFSAQPTRVSSACSCFKGRSPYTITGPYAGPTALFREGRTVTFVTSTQTNTDYVGSGVTTVGGPCPTETDT